METPGMVVQKTAPRKRRGVFREYEPRNLPSRLKLERHRQEMAHHENSFRSILNRKSRALHRLRCGAASEGSGNCAEQSQNPSDHPKRRRIPKHKETTRLVPS